MEKPIFGINIVDCKCWSCGKPLRHLFERDSDNNHRRVWCDECNAARFQLKHEMDALYEKVIKFRMAEKAMQILEKQGIDMDEYREAIEVIADAVRDKRSRFDSAYEMVVAIQLIMHGVKVKTQFDVNGYKIDLMLPGLKAAVEVDGDRHNYNKQKDAERDIYVHEFLGKEWETVRVKPNIIESQLVQILPYIIEKREKQQKLRAENDGMIPWTHDHNEFTEIYRLARKLKPLKN